jgi:hypothetical protein
MTIYVVLVLGLLAFVLRRQIRPEGRMTWGDRVLLALLVLIALTALIRLVN